MSKGQEIIILAWLKYEQCRHKNCFNSKLIDRMTSKRNITFLSLILPYIHGSLLLTLCFLFFIPHRLNAQPVGLPVAYAGSIVEDEEGGSLSFPSFVYVESVRNEIYVIDGKARIIIYTSDFFPLFTLSKRNGIEVPLGLTVDGEGNTFVAQASTKDNPRPRVSVFNACLKWERDIYLEGFEGVESFVPYRLAIGKKGIIYIAGSHFPGVLMINDQGKLLEIISPEEEDRKVNVNYVTIDQAGRIYLVSEETSHIYVYDENRKFLFKFGEKGKLRQAQPATGSRGRQSQWKDVCGRLYASYNISL